jgi:transcriptional regulator with XRE-family HTH domain
MKGEKVKQQGNKQRGGGHEDETATGRSVHVNMGQCIRAMRLERSLSLVEVGARSGFSIGYLSQVERGISSPSLRVMAALGEVFGVGLAGLFAAAQPQAYPIDGVVIRNAERKHLDFWRAGIDKQILTIPDPSFGLNLYMMTIAPLGTTGEDFIQHAGELAGLILEGTFELEVESGIWTLGEGDSFRFAGQRRHRYRNPSPSESTRIYWSIHTPVAAQHQAPSP